MLGRFLGGAAADNLLAVHCVVVAHWFADKEISLAYGIAFSVAMMASTASGFVVVDFVNQHGMGHGLLLGAVISAVSAVSAACVVLLNKAVEGHDDELQSDNAHDDQTKE